MVLLLWNRLKRKSIIKYFAALISIVVGFCVLRGIFVFVGPTMRQSQNYRGNQSYSRLGLDLGLDLISENQNSSVSSDFLSHQRGHHDNVDLDPKTEKDIHLMFIFFQAKQNHRLRHNIRRCLSSIFKNATTAVNITLHFFGDDESFLSLEDILDDIMIRKEQPKVVYHDLNNFPDTVSLMKIINKDISRGAHPFSLPYFYVSLFAHKFLPHTVSRLIALDADLLFQADIADLHALFHRFTKANMIGIARENQPVYRYMFYEFRRKNPGTRVGEPPPDGLTGFNSGVVLLDLGKMRESREYNEFLTKGTLGRLARKYSFQGNLGDQDLLTLLSLEHEHLFYILPCGWNRQLCRWWETSDFEQVFGRYFACKEQVHILHGNCQTGLD